MLEREHEYRRDRLEYPAESKDTDYKSAIEFKEKTDFSAKLVKHILGFANSGGGLLIIGYSELKDGSFITDANISEEVISSYEVTRLCQHVETFLLGQDRIGLKIYKEEFNGVKYPVISIARFTEYPFVCTRDYVSKSGEVILESGQIYIRTEGARTMKVKSPSEWRQLINECIKARLAIEAGKPAEIIEEKSVTEEKVLTEVIQPISYPSAEEIAKKKELESDFTKWVDQESTNALSEIDSIGFSGRFYKGIIQVPYGIQPMDHPTLLKIARNSECHNTGWPIGVILERPEYKPKPTNNGIRTVIKTVRSITTDVQEFDYWALNNRGHFFFMRSNEEDVHRPPKSANDPRVMLFDTTIFRISEILSYSSNLSSELNLKQNDKIRLTLSYEGLKDRVLSSSDMWQSILLQGKKGTLNEFNKELELQVMEIMPKLKDFVYQIAVELFGSFDFYEPEKTTVDSIVDKFLKSRV